MTAPFAFGAALARVRARFDAMLVERLAALRAAERDCANPVLRVAALSEAQSILHKIAGTAGSLGLPDLGAQARDSEYRVIACLERGGRDVNDALASIRKFIALAQG